MMLKSTSYAGLILTLLCVISVSISPGYVMANHHSALGASGNMLVIGPARIIISSSQLNKVCKGDIVVACMTDVSWESVLCLAAGIITDYGDSNCHAALFGKTMGIPVIVGVGNATTTIVDGQTVAIDSSKNSFYIESVAVEVTAPHHGITHKSAGYAPSNHHSTALSHSSVSTAQSFGQKSSVGGQHVNRFNITKEKLRQDQSEIVKFINYVSGRIRLGLKTPKWLAYQWEGIEEDVYDSMPKIFVEDWSDASKINEGFNQLDIDDSVIQYIQEEMETCAGQHKKPIHANVLARISYRKMVDNLGVPESYKQILKRTPLKMNEFVKNNIVKKHEYMRLNMLNLITQHYLKKHGIIK